MALPKDDRTTRKIKDLDRAGAGACPDIPTRNLSNPPAHPYYWAPFILIGNGL